MINEVTLIGNLGTDPEVKRLDSGVVVAKLNLATNENYKDKNGEWQTQTEWHQIVAWRQQAEKAEESFKKGSLIYVKGKLTTRKWQDKDSNDRYTTEVVANYLRKLEKREQGQDSSFPTEAPPAKTDVVPAAPMEKAKVEQGKPSPDDGSDLPF